jgi:hypothetical protein
MHLPFEKSGLVSARRFKVSDWQFATAQHHYQQKPIR